MEWHVDLLSVAAVSNIQIYINMSSHVDKNISSSSSSSSTSSTYLVFALLQTRVTNKVHGGAVLKSPPVLYNISRNELYKFDISTRLQQNKDSIKRNNMKVKNHFVKNNIVLLRDVFHIGLVIGPRPAVLASVAAERQYSRPRTYN